MNILIVRNNSNAGAVDAAMMISTYLASQNIDFLSVDSFDMEGVQASDFDMAVVLGGDGTILRTAHLVATADVPLLGINFGNLGFLANRTEEGIVAILASALAGDAVREERSNLRVDVLCEDDDADAFDASCNEPQDLDGGRSFFALNEAAIARGASGRIIDFDFAINGDHMAAMRGDGLIVASATGSTAYALSAGGPLVAPGFSGLLVVPVALHTLRARTIVTDPSDIVEVSMGQSAASKEAVLFCDGVPCEFDSPIDRIRIRRGSTPTVLLRYKHEGFYAHASRVFF